MNTHRCTRIHDHIIRAQEVLKVDIIISPRSGAPKAAAGANGVGRVRSFFSAVWVVCGVVVLVLQAGFQA